MSDDELLALDAASRRRALAPDSFIVEAPAGAGKTELLTQRVLMLLGRVGEPEEIVAITFTNKAAAEMRHRILDALQRAATGEVPDAAHKRITFDLASAALAASAQQGWQLLDHPGRLRVTTIDAFCAGLARQMPVLSRFGSQPRTVEDARRHYDDAARRALAWLEDDGEHAEAVARALAHVDNDTTRLAGLLADMLARRDQWLRHAVRQSQSWQHAEAALRELVLRDMRRVFAALPGRSQEALMPVARFAAGNLPDDHALAPLRDWQRVLSAEPEELPLWRAVAALLLTDKDEPRKALDVRMGLPKEAKDKKQALLEIIGALSASDVAALAQVRRLPEPGYTEEEWATVTALATLLKLAAGELWGVFHAAGEVDFVEVAGRALQALGSPEAPTDLALSLDYRIRHLLVDEFQDTSPTQVELLQKLTADWHPGDGRSLFLVGDPMQSIYRFRKADVGLFLAAAAQGIGTVPLERLGLYRNNRSCAPVVDWVNATFAQVFPARDDAAAGAIAYRRFAAAHPAMPDAGVTVHGLVAAKGEGAAAEAERILAIIDAERAADPARSIAVLVRARTHLDALVARIRRRRSNLSFTAVEIESLAARQPVQDLLALSHALHHRADRVNWLAILRAPWCGLTLADLHALAADDFNATVWSLLDDAARVARLGADGQARLTHVRVALAEALRQQGRQSAARWVKGAWLRLGGPACLANATELADCEAFFDLIERLDAAGRFSPEQLEREMARLYGAPDATADGRLQFMTLHKAKGLEFDTVILPGLHRPTRSEDKPLMLWEEVILDGLDEHLVAAPLKQRGRKDTVTPYDYLAALERQRAAHEAERVLYVGATRAIRHLHLVGVADRNAKGEIKAPANTPLDLLWPAVANRFADADDAEPGSAEAPSAFIPKLLRVAEPVVTGLPVHAPVAAGAAEKPVADDESGQSLDARVGTLAHRYLEMLANDGLDAWPAARVGSLRGAMEVWLGQQGCRDRDAALGAERVIGMLTTTLASEAGRWVLRARAGAASELALAKVSHGDAPVQVVDRSFVEDGTRWIIDYKTARPDGELTVHAEGYRPQLARYAELFRDEGLPIRTAIFYVALGRLVEFDRQPPSICSNSSTGTGLPNR
ncbi:MAG: UvrD-helicase domain-containing protein [Rhodocyclales bacterium]|nr:UvrD-helicase domain-containing protein [Rhodocyclales bacterium]